MIDVSFDVFEHFVIYCASKLHCNTLLFTYTTLIIGVGAGGARGAIVPPLFKVGGLEYPLAPPLFGPTKMCSASQMP